MSEKDNSSGDLIDVGAIEPAALEVFAGDDDTTPEDDLETQTSIEVADKVANSERQIIERLSKRLPLVLFAGILLVLTKPILLITLAVSDVKAAELLLMEADSLVWPGLILILAYTGAATWGESKLFPGMAALISALSELRKGGK